jgi:hypothetical protein
LEAKTGTKVLLAELRCNSFFVRVAMPPSSTALPVKKAIPSRTTNGGPPSKRDDTARKNTDRTKAPSDRKKGATPRHVPKSGSLSSKVPTVPEGEPSGTPRGQSAAMEEKLRAAEVRAEAAEARAAAAEETVKTALAAAEKASAEAHESKSVALANDAGDMDIFREAELRADAEARATAAEARVGAAEQLAAEATSKAETLATQLDVMTRQLKLMEAEIGRLRAGLQQVRTTHRARRCARHPDPPCPPPPPHALCATRRGRRFARARHPPRTRRPCAPL